MNPPFRREDGFGGKGATPFFRKAIEQHRKGKTVVLVAPTQPYVNVMLEAGAELRSLGRVRWLDVDTGEPCPARETAWDFLTGRLDISLTAGE